MLDGGEHNVSVAYHSFFVCVLDHCVCKGLENEGVNGLPMLGFKCGGELRNQVDSGIQTRKQSLALIVAEKSPEDIPDRHSKLLRPGEQLLERIQLFEIELPGMIGFGVLKSLRDSK